MKNTIKDLKTFLILWSTQSLSQLGSAMTGFALTLWLYEKTGSALQTALLAVCSYAPYVVMSIFAGALSDRWDKKKVMLVCDTMAACCSVAVLVLLKVDLLLPVHMYILNALTGLMNTVQQPASDVAMTMITPKEYYQKTSGLRSLSASLVTILNPILATALYALAGMDIVIYVDLTTFAIAFLSLLSGVKLSVPEKKEKTEKESFLETARAGLVCLRKNELVLVLILFLAGVNFVASAFDAVLPALILPRKRRGGGSWDGYLVRGDCDVCREPDCDGIAGTEEPHPRDLSDDAVFSGNGEFYSGIYGLARALVRGTDHRLASCACDERQS